MSSNSKFVVGIIVGVLFGLIGGFLYYDSKIQNFTAEISYLTGDLEDADMDLTDILREYSELNDIYAELLDNYEELSDNYDDLLIERNALDSNYDDMESAYNELLDDYELLVASLPLSPQQVSGTTLERNYEWFYGGEKYELSLSIPETQYIYYKDLERIHDKDYSVYCYPSIR